jgi:DDE superfamily endonuclease
VPDGAPVEVWFQDEMRMGQKGTVRRVWAAKGSRPRAPRALGFKWTYVFGAVCPGRGAAAGLVLPVANVEAMALHLAEISAQVAPGAHAVVVLDGAGYHQAKALAGRVPTNLSLLPLPPYSPELNPMELVWQDLRRRDLANRVFDDLGRVIDACCQAWTKLVADTARLISLTDFAWARLNPETS